VVEPLTIDQSTRLDRLASMEGTHFWSIGRDELVRGLIDRHHMEPPFVDAGSGTGAFAATLAESGYDVTFFDTGPTRAPGFRASITAIPLATASAGTVMARDVLEHVDDRAALGECHRILRSGGHLLVTVPGWPSLWSPRDELAGHLRRYRWRDLVDVVEAAGFEVVERRGYQFVLLPLLVASRLAARVRPRRQLAVEERSGGAAGRVLTAINVAEAHLARRGRFRPPTGSTLALVAVRR
jgi:SAM-dependent methyltransferase